VVAPLEDLPVERVAVREVGNDGRASLQASFHRRQGFRLPNAQVDDDALDAPAARVDDGVAVSLLEKLEAFLRSLKVEPSETLALLRSPQTSSARSVKV
ncbi:hypothetical protein, partial [Escherichia coli]|uniref:hypothetical protein n=1 Tax=Escherichia coli TaxID=562 RepID=UPI001BDCEF73